MPANEPLDEPVVSENGASNGHNGKHGTNLPEFVYNGEVVVSGFAGRFPDCDNIKEFRDKLMAKEDLLVEDDRRWKAGLYGLSKRAGKLKDIELFDAEFFDVCGKEADYMGPENRMLLETCYEAIVDAGLTMDMMKGSRTGVFVGISYCESQEPLTSNAEILTPYTLMGCCRANSANRIANFFDLKGPCFTVDTACSAVPIAWDQALFNIRMGTIDSAFVCGTNLAMRVNSALQFLKMGMSSKEGICKVFDAKGNGYARSETVGAVLLQKAEDCRRIYATMVHCKSANDGFKKLGITYPSGEEQKRLELEVVNEAGIDPTLVQFVEAHGTGTKAGDPEEVNAFTDVYCPGRKEPLLIASVKSNMGHAESSSGIGSFAKILIAMEERVIPPNIHYEEPNPDITGLMDGRLKVVTEPTKWNGGYVAMNSSGFGGANVHTLFKSYDKELTEPHVASKKTRLFTCCARTEEGVKAVLADAKKNAHSIEFQALIQDSANMPTNKMPYRGYTVLNATKDIQEVQKCGLDRRPIWFICSGMGAQWDGMGRKMMELDVFRESIMKSTKILSKYDLDLYDIIMNKSNYDDNFIQFFTATAAVQVALIDLLFAMDIQPDGIIGHSSGETVSGYADGSLTHEETILSAYWKGRCVKDAILPKGMMAAVGLTLDECKRMCPPGVVPACHNAVDNITISGPYEATSKFVEELTKKGIFAREVKSSFVAYHSPDMDNVAVKLKSELEKIIKPKKRSPKWISTSFPEERWNDDIAQYSSADYHAFNFRRPTLFHEGLQKVPSNAIVIEVAPHCLLQTVLKRSLGPQAVFVGTMKHSHENNVEVFLSSMGSCFDNGMDLSPLKLFPPVQFPVPRGTPFVSPCISKIWDHSVKRFTLQEDDFAYERSESACETKFEIDVSPGSDDHYLADHIIDGRCLLAGTGYVVLAWRALARMRGELYEEMPVIARDIKIHQATVLPPNDAITLAVNIIPMTGEFEIREHSSLVASGIIYCPEGPALDRDCYPYIRDIPKRVRRTEFTMTGDELYKELRLRGYEYGPNFRKLKTCGIMGENAEIEWDGRWIAFMDNFLHLKLAASEFDYSLNLPTRFEYIKIDPRLQPRVDGAPIVLPAYNDIELETVVSGGVELGRMYTSVAPKKEVHVPPVVEEYRFVPDTDNIDEAIPQSLEKYATDCLSFAMTKLKKLLADDIDKIVPNRGLLNDAVKACKTLGANKLQDIMSEPDSGLFQFLEKLFDLPMSSSFPDDVQDLLQSFRPQLTSDRLLSALSSQEILKPSMDIVLANTSQVKLSVFEAGAAQSAMYSRIIPMLKTVADLTVNYTAADKIPLDKDSKNLGVNALLWDPSASASIPPGKMHLLVLKNILHKQADISKTLEIMFSMLHPEGFILVEEVTQNFSLQLTLEALAEPQLESTFVDAQRVSGMYLTEGSWTELFLKHNLEIVYKKSDNLLSTMFLLRRKGNIVAPPSMMFIDDLRCSWLEDLKAKMKELVNAPEGTRLWLVAKQNISGLMGFVKCLRHESGGDKIRSVFVTNLKPSSSEPDISLQSPIFEELMRKDLVYNVYRDGQWGSFAHLPIPTGPTITVGLCEHASIQSQSKGDLSSLKWTESDLKYADKLKDSKTAVLCSVYCSALNFRDIMLATGKLPHDLIPGYKSTKVCVYGLEFSGRTPDGKRVCGTSRFDRNGLATTARLEPWSMLEIPDHWTMEEAASVPIVYATVYYGMVLRGQLKKGDRVLIHSGSGGVGHAAISVALSYGCEVFTTVGTKEKREYLKKAFPQLKDRNISNSRDLSFVHDILKETEGKGVDMVLNSLSGEKLHASLSLLAKNGRFVEIGKTDLTKDTAIGLAMLQKNISFVGILVDYLMGRNTEEEWTPVMDLVREGIRTGVVKPLPTNVFDNDEVEDAFRFLAQGKHIGKIIIKIRDEEKEKVVVPKPFKIPAIIKTLCDPTKTYIIIGGLGGFGIELAHWLVNKNATKVVLNSRSGVKNGFQRCRIEHWRDEGVTVEVSTRDVTTMEGAKALLQESGKLGPVGGIFNLAMVLRDGLFENQTNEMYREVIESKVQGTINLDIASRELCKDSLDWFVAFSSYAAGRGNLGQTSYGFGNSVMERICEKRRAEGLHGLAVQWGLIGDVGYVAELEKGKEILGGLMAQRIVSCLSVFDQFLTQSRTVVSSFVIEERDAAGQDGSSRPNLVEAVSRIIGMKNSSLVDPETTLSDMGLDSLMSVEIKHLLEREVDVSLSTREIGQLNMNKISEMMKDTA